MANLDALVAFSSWGPTGFHIPGWSAGLPYRQLYLMCTATKQLQTSGDTLLAGREQRGTFGAVPGKQRGGVGFSGSRFQGKDLEADVDATVAQAMQSLQFSLELPGTSQVA